MYVMDNDQHSRAVVKEISKNWYRLLPQSSAGDYQSWLLREGDDAEKHTTLKKKVTLLDVENQEDKNQIRSLENGGTFTIKDELLEYYLRKLGVKKTPELKNGIVKLTVSPDVSQQGRLTGSTAVLVRKLSSSLHLQIAPETGIDGKLARVVLHARMVDVDTKKAVFAVLE